MYSARMPKSIIQSMHSEDRSKGCMLKNFLCYLLPDPRQSFYRDTHNYILLYQMKICVLFITYIIIYNYI